MDMNSGYDGYSMSKRAASAYLDGEMPISKWNKKAILEAISELTDAEYFGKLTVSELKSLFLNCSSWHHTSKYANATDFYSIDEEAVLTFTEADAYRVISDRKPRKRREKSVIEAEKVEKERIRKKKEQKKAEKEDIENLFKYQLLFTKNPCRTLNGFIKRIEKGLVSLDELRVLRHEKILEKREALRSTWIKQGYQTGLDSIEDDKFIDSYIKLERRM